MSEQGLDQLDEFKASGEDSEVMEPTGVTAKKRKADKLPPKDKDEKVSDGVNKMGGDLITTVTTAKAPKRKADKTMGEHVSDMFEGEDLSEEFKEKASVIFEAAVNEKVSERVEELEEQFNEQLQEQAETVAHELIEKVDTYLNYVVEQWREDNELAIDQGIKSDIAESLIRVLGEAFVEHNIDLGEEKVDVVAELADKIDELENALNEQINENIELTSSLEQSLLQDALEEVSEGLAQTQAEKLQTLTEGLEYVDLDDFKRKANIIKENYFSKSSSTMLTEDLDDVMEPLDVDGGNTRFVDPTVAAYAKNISKTFGKSK